jgi:nitrogen fixation NifU-like protein
MRSQPPIDVMTMTELDQKLLDHFLNPRNVGEINHPDGYGRAINPINQYFTDIYLKVRDGIITEITFKTFGCVVTIAAASALTEIVKGKSIENIIDKKNALHELLSSITQELGAVPEKNWHCPPAAVHALLNAFSDYYQKRKEDIKVKQLNIVQEELQYYFKNR